MLELGEAQLQRRVLLPRHEPELAREALTGLLRQVAELLDAGAQLRSELVDELPERETRCYLARPCGRVERRCLRRSRFAAALSPAGTPSPPSPSPWSTSGIRSGVG